MCFPNRIWCRPFFVDCSFLFNLSWICNRFSSQMVKILINFASQNRLQIDADFKLGFWSLFGSILAPFCPQFGPLWAHFSCKLAFHRLIQTTFLAVLSLFSAILAPSSATDPPKGLPRPPKTTPRPPKRAPKTRQDPPPSPKTRLSTPPGPSNTDPTTLETHPCNHTRRHSNKWAGSTNFFGVENNAENNNRDPTLLSQTSVSQMQWTVQPSHIISIAARRNARSD